MYLIYIPLWFYSNYRCFCKCHIFSGFTFHYGSILMSGKVVYIKPFEKFTFHYGSILIIVSKSFTDLLWSIYIPLWFYSNAGGKVKRYDEICIYIPLWFYSNMAKNLLNQINSGIYIPLWFYSNTMLILFFLCNFKFTFHYGSILIEIGRLALIGWLIYIPLWFYSNADLEKQLSELPHLHSTMVLF